MTTITELNRELLASLEVLRDNYNQQGYSIAATELDGLLDTYYAEREQITQTNKETNK